MLKDVRQYFFVLRRKIQRLGRQQRSILAITVAPALQTQLHIFSVHERWKFMLAKSVADARLLMRVQKVSVIIYDREGTDAEWTQAIRLFRGCPDPPLFILLTGSADRRIWKSLLDCGGYDMALKPVDRQSLARLLNGAVELDACVEELVGT